MVSSPGRLPLGGSRARAPLVCAINGLASKWSSAGSEAAKLFTEAAAHLAEGRTSVATPSATKALEKFSGQSDKEGKADAQSILVSCSALEASLSGARPTAAFDMAADSVKEFAKAGDKRGEACMKLALAELGGCLAKDSGDFEEALEKADEALSTFQDTKDKKMEACSQLVLSTLNYKRQRVTETRQAANAALMMFMDLEDQVGQAKSFQALALSYCISDDLDNVLNNSKQALALYKDAGIRFAQILVLQTMAQKYMEVDKPQKSLKCSKDALAIIRELGCHKRYEAILLLSVAESLFADGYGKRAIKTVQEGLSMLRKTEDKSGIAAGLQALMHTHLLAGSPGEALQAGYEAKELVNAIGSKYLEIDFLHSRSQALLASGELDMAVKALRDAAEIARELDDAEEEAEAFKAVALAYGDGSEAQSAIAEARSLCQDVRYVLGEASALLLGGSLLLKSGANADEILGEAEDARGLCQEAEDVVGEAAALKMIVECYVGKKDLSAAMEAASDRVELYKQVGRKKAQAEAMCSIAHIHLLEEESEEVTEVIEEGLALAKEVGAKALEARLLLLQAQVCLMGLQKETAPTSKKAALSETFIALRNKATKSTKDALALAGKSGDKSLRASALFWQSEVLVWSFRGGEAMETAEQSAQLFAKLEDTRGEGHAKALLADLLLSSGKKAEAKELANEALELVKGKPGCADAEAAVNKALEKIAKKEAVPMMGGGKRMVQKMVKKWRKKGGGGGGSKKGGGMDKTMAISKLNKLANDVVTGDDGAMEADVPFMEAGIDSLGSVQFVSDASREFSMNLPPSIVFDFPTVRALAEHLVEEMGDAGGGGGGDDDGEWEEYEEMDWVEEDVPMGMMMMAAAPSDAPVAAAASAPTEAVAKKLDKAAVKTTILKLAQDVITDGDEMTIDVPFMEAGLDSLASVQFVSDVSRNFSMNFPPSVIFDFPTGRALIDHIIEEAG